MSPLSPRQQDAIRSLLRTCGQQSQQMMNDFQVFEKGQNDYVTTVDRALDRQLTAGFSALFPNDGVVSEENPQSWQAVQQGFDRLWFVDPIDGTDDFIHGKPHYSVMAGLLSHHQPIAGWVYAPAFDQLCYGGRGWGLFQTTGDTSPSPLIPTQPHPLSRHHCPILIGYKDQHQFGEAIAHLIPAAQFGSIGSFGLKVLQVIQGKAGLYVYFNRRVKLWDTTGPIALAIAAGLICCDLEGNSLYFTPEAIDPETLAHQQPILIGWADYVEALRPRIKQAVLNRLAQG